jgi:DNA polymerase-4
VEPNRPAKSSSSECTYAQDLTDILEMRREVDEMARANAAWLKRKGLLARTVTIKVRYDDFTTITRSDSRLPTADADEIARRAVELLGRTEAGRRPVRLLGAGVHNFLGGHETDEDDPSWLPFGDEPGP